MDLTSVNSTNTQSIRVTHMCVVNNASLQRLQKTVHAESIYIHVVPCIVSSFSLYSSSCCKHCKPSQDMTTGALSFMVHCLMGS